MFTKSLNLLFSAVTVLIVCQSAPAQERPRFTIESPDKQHASCVLIALTDDGKLRIDDAGARRTLDRFIEIRQDGRKLPPLLTGNFVSLSNGDRLPLQAEAASLLEEGRLRVFPAKSLGESHAKGLTLLAPTVVLLFWAIPDGVDDAERFFAELQDEKRKRDVVYLKDGDRIEGTVTELSGKVGCVIATDRRKVQTPWSKLAGIAFSTYRQASLRTKNNYSRAVLDGGARVNFSELRFDEKPRRWVGKTQFGATLDLPETSLLGVDMRQASAVDLSELTPTRYEHRAYLSPAWPLMKDAAATGQPMRLAGNTFEKGLGMHAACQVVYKLDGQYQRFDAEVGIDESSRRGRARVAIELDGKRIALNDGKELTSKTAPIAVRFDVRGVRSLTLIVELGSFGDVQADVNWAKARLVKKESVAVK